MIPDDGGPPKRVRLILYIVDISCIIFSYNVSTCHKITNAVGFDHYNDTG